MDPKLRARIEKSLRELELLRDKIQATEALVDARGLTKGGCYSRRAKSG